MLPGYGEGQLYDDVVSFFGIRGIVGLVRGDAQMVHEQVVKAEENLFEADAEPQVDEVVADKGYDAEPPPSRRLLPFLDKRRCRPSPVQGSGSEGFGKR